jgi:hypothetical protein
MAKGRQHARAKGGHDLRRSRRRVTSENGVKSSGLFRGINIILRSIIGGGDCDGKFGAAVQVDKDTTGHTETFDSHEEHCEPHIW